MAYNEALTKRLRDALAGVPKVEEKRMFRGVTFMINGKMAMSAGDDKFMFRIDPALHDEVVEKEGVNPVIMRGREYKGYVHVHEDAVLGKRELDKWVKLALDFNAKAKASVKKKKK
ncbi:MAG TPA: TfoX/Sxy family protein [Candidatus Kapabacteria bacterium]|nr:TfoX/Sxy family protein [Candidatus Kapabacteria bacterium]